jgi:hypothetical protein
MELPQLRLRRLRERPGVPRHGEPGVSSMGGSYACLLCLALPSSTSS